MESGTDLSACDANKLPSCPTEDIVASVALLYCRPSRSTSHSFIWWLFIYIFYPYWSYHAGACIAAIVQMILIIQLELCSLLVLVAWMWGGSAHLDSDFTPRAIVSGREHATRWHTRSMFSLLVVSGASLVLIAFSLCTVTLVIANPEWGRTKHVGVPGMLSTDVINCCIEPMVVVVVVVPRRPWLVCHESSQLTLLASRRITHAPRAAFFRRHHSAASLMHHRPHPLLLLNLTIRFIAICVA